MKRLIVLAMLGFAAMSATPAKAQVSVNINIGSQPDWGPRGYDYVDYYYLPEVESYYYVPTRQFIYMDRGRWIHTKNLPSRYRGYNLHSGRKIVINDNRPYLRHKQYRTRYASNNYYSRPNHVVYRENYKSKDYKNYREKDSKNYRSGKQQAYHRSESRDQGRKDNKRGNGHGNDNHGNGRGNGRH